MRLPPKRSRLRGPNVVLPLLASLLVTSASASATADDSPDLEALLQESVVSGASKVSEAASDAPATTSTITAEDIRRYGIRSLDEAIDFLSMGLMTSNHLHSVEVGGRGVLLTGDYGNHVLLVVDGHVMNEGWSQSAYFEQGAGIPMELIDHIEIVLGPGSVLYGGSAMLAVVNVVTKRAADYGGPRVLAEGSLSPQQGIGGRFTSFAPGDLGGSYRIGAGIGHQLRLFGMPAELTAQLELYRQNGPSFEFQKQTVLAGDGSPKPFGPRAAPGTWGGRVSHEYFTSVPAGYARFILGNLTVMARAAAYERATPYTNGLNRPFGDFDDGRDTEVERWVSLDVQYRSHLSRKLTVNVHGYADSYDYRQTIHAADGADCSIATPGPCRSQSNGASRWIGGEVQGVFDWFGDDRASTMAGIDGRVRFVGTKTDSLDETSGQQMGSVGAGHVTELPWAAYLQQRFSPTKRLHLNAGARLDSAPRGGRRLSPRLAIAYEVWKGGVAKAVYAEAFRAPTYYEAYYNAYDQLPAPNLRPEVERGAEASFEQTFGRHKLLFGVFRTWWSDMVALRFVENSDGKYQYENVSSIDNAGYNARLEGTFGELRYGLSVTGAHSRRSSPDGTEPLPVAPQLFGNARVSYDLPGRLPVAALATQLVGPRLADRAFDGGFPETPVAPAQVRLRLTFSDAVSSVPGLSYRVGFDFATASRSAYVAGPNQYLDPADPARPSAQLAPVNRLSAFSSLQYEF